MADMDSVRPGRNAEIGWYSPDPRAVLPLADGALHVPRSLAKTIRQEKFEITTDRAFQRVMVECARPRTAEAEGGAWISDEMIRAYTELHRLGFAHSVEAWRGQGSDAMLVGGLYGVSIGAAFFAESMFCRPASGGTDASKVCLVRLAEHARRCGYMLLDVQLANPHTQRFGVVEVSRKAFLDHLQTAICQPDRWLALATQSRTTPAGG